MRRVPPRSSRTDTLFPNTSPFRSGREERYQLQLADQHGLALPRAAAPLSLLIENREELRGHDLVAERVRVGIAGHRPDLCRVERAEAGQQVDIDIDRKSTRLNSSH